MDALNSNPQTTAQHIVTAGLMLLMCACFPAHAVSSRTVHPHAVGIHASDRQIAKLTGLVRRCAETTDTLFGTKDRPTASITIHVTDNPISSSDPLVVTLTEDQSLLEVTHAVARSLVLRQAAAHGDTPDGAAVDWLAAAVVSQALISHRSGMGYLLPDFRPIRAALEVGNVPMVTALLESPLPPDHPVTYTFYALHCHVLAKAIQHSRRSGKGNPLNAVLQLQARGKTAADAVAAVVQPGGFAERTALQQWYAENAPNACRMTDERFPAPSIIRKLRNLETARMAIPGRADGTNAPVPLDEIPRRMRKKILTKDHAQHLELQTQALAAKAPEILRPPLYAYAQAFGLAAKGKDRAFVRALKAARKALSEAAERQALASSYLDGIEDKYTSIEERFGLYLRITRQHRDQRRALEPALQAYLDSLEP